LEHDHPELHWDFMLQAGEVLRTWRLAEPPRAGRNIAATALFDHRLLYLDYEGPVSGDRGTVKRWDHGEYSGALEGERVAVWLRGQRLKGQVVLMKQKGAEWQFELSGAP
jgi:hypothetical protein